RADVDLLARKGVAYVAQKPPAIGRRHGHVYRIGAHGVAPLRVDQALGLRLGEALQAWAVLPVHRDALTARDEAADRIGRHRLAAFGELRHQAVDTADGEHAAALRRRRPLRRASAGEFGLRPRTSSRICQMRVPELAQGGLELAQVDLVARYGDEKIFRLLEAEPRRQALQA